MGYSNIFFSGRQSFCTGKTGGEDSFGGGAAAWNRRFLRSGRELACFADPPFFMEEYDCTGKDRHKMKPREDGKNDVGERDVQCLYFQEESGKKSHGIFVCRFHQFSEKKIFDLLHWLKWYAIIISV